jgi:CRISPR system Cascade subunit CasC
MVAEMPKGEMQVDAACQVAHALSANKVGSMERDFYTAVDDFKERDKEAGAGMMGTVEFNSPCFYRYANVDLNQLARNLLGKEWKDATDSEKQEAHKLAHKTVEAFVRAAVEAIPSGMQNSMAAHNCPSLIFAVVRDRGLWSLANAFVQPVRPDRDNSLVENSIKALDGYWGKLIKGFGAQGIRACPVFILDEADTSEKDRHLLTALKESQVSGFEALLKQVMQAVSAGATSEEGA